MELGKLKEHSYNEKIAIFEKTTSQWHINVVIFKWMVTGKVNDLSLGKTGMNFLIFPIYY